MKLKKKGKDVPGQEAEGSVHIKADDRLKELEELHYDDIVRFKRILSIDPVKYLKPQNKFAGLAVVQAFREAQQIAFDRLVDLKVIDPKTGRTIA